MIGMMNRKTVQIKLFVTLILLTLTMGVKADVLERFVKTTTDGGSAIHDGTSWAQALDNVQDAINNLRSAMQSHGVSSGILYVAEGTYNPTESTEPSNSNILNTSFLIYEGITIYGGYPKDISDGDDYSPQNRIMDSDGLDVDDNEVFSPWHFRYKTILSGNHSGLNIEFQYNENRGMYDTRFPSNSFHVVWFGTKGEIEHEQIKGHRKGYTAPAGIDGCIIEGGFASSKDLKNHDHMAYGGGAYMVPNTFLRNCIVRKCQAAQRGGGVYMDGGGRVEHCLVEQCQATGVAIAQGYGGGVCIDYDGAVVASYLVQNGARIGGGLAICHTPSEYPFDAISPYMPYATACIIANNTSNAEGGGVYLDEGGTLNHCTVVKNRCTGPDITYYGRRHGRSGGVYVRNCGMIYNSVFWANMCAANSDVQFASIQQTGASTTGIDVFHSAFYQMDITDWSGVNKYEVYSLTSWNRPHRANADHCPWFEMNPDLLGPSNEGSLWRDLKAGIDYDDDTRLPKTPQIQTTWRPQHNSYLVRKGILVSQTIHLNSNWIRHASTNVDMMGRAYDKVSSLGALSNKDESYDYALVVPQAEEGRTGPDKDIPLPTVFVDFNRDNYYLSEAHIYEDFGKSWTQPMMQLSDAINYFEQYRIKEGADKDKYRMPDHVSEGAPQTYTTYPAVQVLIKSGTTTTAGHGNYVESGDLRSAAIRPKSNMRFYGGYPDELSATNVVETIDGVEYRRNPGEYQTMVSSNVVNDYSNASAHAFALINVHDVIIDGLRMAYGNVASVESDGVVKKGAGVIVGNNTVDVDERIDMTNIIVRNCVISNTQAHDGAGVYVSADQPKANGSVTRAEVDIRNTIVRNCTALQDEDMMMSSEYPGIMVANGNARISIDHCTIANNVGYPLRTTTAMGFTGQILLRNTALFANSRDVVSDRQSITSFVATSGDNISGGYNMIDRDAPKNAVLAADATNQYVLDIDNTSDSYPTFKNPSFNVGHSEGVDRPLYGGTVSYEPLNKNPLVNAADDASMTSHDRTDINFFDFGGGADIGAVENTSLPKKGTVIYVTPDGAGKRDGSSWSNAIAGNTVYVIEDIAGPALATGDQKDIDSDRILDSAGNPVLTTDAKYCGGFGRSYFKEKMTGGTSSTVVTKTWTVEKNVWDDGDRAGEEEYLRDDVSPTVVSEVTPGSAGSIDGTFVAGWMYDSRYPYGEISGASRTFWRANPYTGYLDGIAASNDNDLYSKVESDGSINNAREERYVSGLQYAVERASAYNILAEDAPGRIAGVDSVQVWISNGRYTDYKGYVMRDKTTVMGSFPAVKGGSIKTPGLLERQALMSSVVSIPKAMVAEKLDPVDYETILQVSDTDPKTDNVTFNTSAVNYWDDDLRMLETTDSRTFAYKTNTITHHFHVAPPLDVTNSYIFEPAFAKNSYKSITTTDVDGYRNIVFGTEESGKDQWHLKYPIKTNYVVNIENSSNSNSKSRVLYDPDTNVQLSSPNATDNVNWVFLGNGSLTGVELMQTVPSLPAGNYNLTVDMAGGYRNKFSTTDPTNIFFHIIGDDGTELITPVMLKTRGSYTSDDNSNTNRNMAYRYSFYFEQPVTGSLTIKVDVRDGVRNTRTANATYGTDDGGDPDEIPTSYTDSYGANNPNRREFWMSDLRLISVSDDYVLASTDNETEDRDDVPEAYREEDGVVTSVSSEVITHRTALRKRVLSMPDVTVPTYGYGSYKPVLTSRTDNSAHTDRVPVGNIARNQRTATTQTKRSDSHYVGYTNVNWDGFTIRHGFIYDDPMVHGGGAGVAIFEGANLRNCVVINNFAGAQCMKGGGIFCDGATSTIEGCFVLNNTSSKGTATEQNQIFAGGLFMYEGTCFNSLFAKNYSYGTGGGLGFCVGRFYNNTVAYNVCDYTENGAKNGGAIALATSSAPNLFIANTIIYGNNGRAIRERGTSIKMKDISPFIHCYIQSTVSQNENYFTKNIGNHNDNNVNYGVGNIFFNGVAPSALNTPFQSDLDEDDNYTGNAETYNDFRLHTANGATCVNTGTEDFAPKLLEALTYKKAGGDFTGDITTSNLYKNVEKVVLPKNDVAFADRVQDCSIDIGAYEYDGAIDIKPDITTFADKKLAVYYVSQNGNIYGNASADSPENAACAAKLQKVLDAAGRYKYDLYEHPELHEGHADFTVVVALSGNDKGNTFAYTPERLAEQGVNDDADNVLAYSLIIPHGVQLWGEFHNDFYESDGEGNVTMLRDILRYRTYISGEVMSSTGTTGKVHHVIHFTNDLYDLSERKMDGQVLGGKLEVLTEEKDRAVLDGLFITNGHANGAPGGDGSVTTGMNGAAAIVPGYAHIRNCVITGNEAAGYGGGLYLKPRALVTGTIVDNNIAKRGGGIYVEQPAGDVVNSGTFAYILTTTVVDNEASEVGGGLYFESNLRANSSVFWHNTALDRNNVSGWLVQESGVSSSISSVSYPMAYCGVEVSRWEGVNNLLVSASETEGVRWDHKDYYELYYHPGDEETLYYYPIEMSSVLSRSGMTYDAYRKYCLQFPTMSTAGTTDIAGYEILSNAEDVLVTYDGDDPYSYVRKKKNNALIDMGARVVNANFEVTFDAEHVMTRLFVVHTEDLESESARELQDNLYADEATAADAGLTAGQKNLVRMYSQMGSCFTNPFHRLGDALQYIINVRKDALLGDIYKDTRFEVFVTNGTFYPYRNAYGMEAASRSNTFVIPEEVTLIGGVDNTRHYGQAGWGNESNTSVDDNVIVPVRVKNTDGSYATKEVRISTVSTDVIRHSREQSDLNMNNVVEPWELNKQTILSGTVVSGTESQNAYHVVTCYSDADKLGKLPTMYSDSGCTERTTDRKSESRESVAKRTIFLDGITISDGTANDISEEDELAAFQRVTYFRGGGIFVDGNWDHVSEDASYIPEVIGVAERNIPLVVTSSQFQNNMAGNGGAIYTNGSLLVTGSHFAQNSSRGPDTERDQRYIPWTAGGAIATNYDCTLVNTIFANNEAKRGKLPITIPGSAGVEMADIRQGFGGVISSSETSTVHALNCNFVRNKAVAFPAIYNFLSQSQKAEKSGGNYVWERGERKHWAVNCILWGNEVNEDVSSGGQIDSYIGDTMNDPDGRTLGSLFTVSDPSKTARRRADVANFGINNRNEEVLFFCAYEEENGLNSKLIVEDDAHRDAHKKATVDTWDYFENGTFVDERPIEWIDDNGSHTNNQLLDANNDALSGPNFIQPSITAGVEGYMQNADWLVSRLNRLIDTGWSYLPQHVTSVVENHEGHNVDVFKTVFEHTDESIGEEPLYDENGDPVLDDQGNQVMQPVINTPDEMDNTTLRGSGIYNFYSLGLDELYGGVMGMEDLAPIGEHPHMKYDQFGLKTGMNSTMRRISTYPKQGEQEVFIDIGVYEYQYVQLFIPGNAYDVIWVRPDNPSDGTVADGTTWARATNNVQQAIDMLMSSHNNNDKILKVRAGEYSPVYLTHGQLAFYIEHDENPASILYPSAVAAGQELHVNSITIRGGYPNEDVYMIPDNTGDYDGESVRNPEQFPARFVMSGTTGYEDRPDVKENLFVVRNMEMQTTVTNFIAQKEINKQGFVVPVAFEGLTFSNPYAAHPGGESENLEGAAILYMQQNKRSGGLCEAPATKDIEDNRYEVDGRPKLLVKDCIFLDNSNPDKNGGRTVAPAVNIKNGGGDALVVNSLFHGNGGSPLAGINTKVINCAFALNEEPLTLTNDFINGTGSVMHNSIIWKDATDEDLPYNLETDEILGSNNAVFGDDRLSDTPDARGNQNLSETNNDILHGPNFTNPWPNDPWQRDMHPRPTDILMSKADRESYKNLVPYYRDVSTFFERSMEVNGELRTSTIQTVTRTLQNKSDYSADDWNELWKGGENDLANTPRFRGKGLERGPYEVQAAVQRVYYMNPSLMPSANSDGATWERAFSEGHLQDAIDAAGVYSATNGGQRAFIFVKGDGYSLNEPVLARDGVTVIGGVTNTVDHAVAKPEVVDGDHTFKDVEIFNYINRVRAERSGVATTDVSSMLKGLTAEGDIIHGFLMDGFTFTNPDVVMSEAPVALLSGNTVLRNCVIHDNKMSNDIPVVNIDKGILYNTLLYNNDATTHVNVGEGATGGVLNCTVVANEEGQTAVSSATDNHVVNTITYNEVSKTVSSSGTFAYSNTKTGMFAPYQRHESNAYDYPFGDKPALWYQLHEGSECINTGTNDWQTYFPAYGSLWDGLTGDDDDGWVPDYMSQSAQKFIDFTQDRDVLGNPRKLFATVDKGAFETWRITDNAVIEATSETDDPLCPVTNFGGHLYPHTGSVTYIGENATFCLNAGDFATQATAVSPGYLLLKKGASLYGQGNHIRVPYVAVERSLGTDSWNLFSLPYDWKRANIVSVNYNSSTDAITEILRYDAINSIQAYDGARRAEWNYDFQTVDSPCWVDVEEDDQVANEGYLLNIADGSSTLRFTAWGVDENGLSSPIYSEYGLPKTVLLHQNDNMPADGSAHFTANENMGWNLKGMPWLVNSYMTYATDASGDYDASSEAYNMNVPHIFYKMNSDGTYIKDAALYTQQSWSDGARMTLGDAYFTQTAVIGNDETLTFRMPEYHGETPSSAARQHVGICKLSSTRATLVDDTPTLFDDVVGINPMTGGDATLPFHWGSDGLKWMSFDYTLPQIYVLAPSGVRMSLVSAAPVETDIPLGVLVPDAGNYLISLPQDDDYADFSSVWLIDEQTGMVTDLKKKNYVLSFPQDGLYEQRLKLRFGSLAAGNSELMRTPSVLKVLANDGLLPLSQFNDDDNIVVYSVGGIMMYKGTVSESQNHSFADGVYVVRRVDAQ